MSIRLLVARMICREFGHGRPVVRHSRLVFCHRCGTYLGWRNVVPSNWRIH